jgi:uncharacterized membrane protein YcaP (DUF421 family)
MKYLPLIIGIVASSLVSYDVYYDTITMFDKIYIIISFIMLSMINYINA